MAEYTRAIDAQISQLLQQRGSVTPHMLAGVDPDEAAVLLAQYVRVHAHEVAFVFDGERLTWAQAVPAPPPAVPEPSSSDMPPTPPYAPNAAYGAAAPAVSPVDQVLAAPPGKALLDVAPSGGPYPKWAWWPPLAFGLIGGLFSWLVVRHTNPRAARNMLITGVVVQVVSTGLALMLMASAQPMLGQVRTPGQGSSWPPSQTQRVAFYYFGTST